MLLIVLNGRNLLMTMDQEKIQKESMMSTKRIGMFDDDFDDIEYDDASYDGVELEYTTQS